jgi:Ca2+-binding RTX toxin-like protein
VGRTPPIGGQSNDIFEYNQVSHLQAGESIDGGGGTDQISLNAPGSFDFTGVTVASIETLHFFHDSITATLAGSQIGTGAITAIVDSASFTSTLAVVGSAVDLSGVTFTNWTNGVDNLDISGTAGAETLTGSDQDDLIQGFAGADAQNGGAGDTFLIVGSQGLGDTFMGGAGMDTLKVAGSAAATLAAFKSAASSIEMWAGNGKGLFGTSGANAFDLLISPPNPACHSSTGLPAMTRS